MDDLLLHEAIERYLNGQMPEGERMWFEELRQRTPEIDQLVVEHRLLMEQMEAYGERNQLQHSLTASHERLVETGEIVNSPLPLTTRGRIVQMYHRYKRVTAIAASIAGVTALMISALMAYLSPVPDAAQIQKLGNDIKTLKEDAARQKARLAEQNATLNDIASKVPDGAVITGGGSAFLIDGKGYLVTNAHVVKGSKFVTVADNDGRQYRARTITVDNDRDLALLRIQDEDYKPQAALPYSVRKQKTDLGEDIFTLGYPRNEIVYNAGYLSATTGFGGDTSAYQISLNANPGNSGGPVFNGQGELIGILSARQLQADGVVFAVRSTEVKDLVSQAIAADTSVHLVSAPATNGLKGLKRTAQLKKLQRCVFSVRAFQ